MYSVYVIFSERTHIKYTGHTEDLELRLAQHNEGSLGRYTKNKGPWKIIYQENFNSRAEAMAREKYLKTGVGREFIKRETGY